MYWKTVGIKTQRQVLMSVPAGRLELLTLLMLLIWILAFPDADVEAAGTGVDTGFKTRGPWQTCKVEEA